MAHAGGGEGDDALVIPLTQNGLDQSGFAGSVGADEGNHFTAMDMEIHIPKDGVMSNFDG